MKFSHTFVISLLLNFSAEAAIVSNTNRSLRSTTRNEKEVDIKANPSLRSGSRALQDTALIAGQVTPDDKTAVVAAKTSTGDDGADDADDGADDGADDADDGADDVADDADDGADDGIVKAEGDDGADDGADDADDGADDAAPSIDDGVTRPEGAPSADDVVNVVQTVIEAVNSVGILPVASAIDDD